MSGTQSLRPDARAGFELTSFEEVRATPATSLLRLTGWWHRVSPPAAPALVTEAAGRRERIAPLAGPPPESGSAWRAGYAIGPDALATPGIAIYLDAGDGELVSLPLPSRVRAPSIGGRASARSRVAERQAPVPIRLSEDEIREREKMERLSRELERAHREVERLGQLESRLLRSEAALTAAEAQIEVLRAQLQEARAHAADLAARRRD